MLTARVITYQFGYETHKSRAIRPIFSLDCQPFGLWETPAGRLHAVARESLPGHLTPAPFWARLAWPE